MYQKIRDKQYIDELREFINKNYDTMVCLRR